MGGKEYNLINALSWYTVGNILIKAVNFLTLRLFTNLLSTIDYGIFGIYQSYLNIFEMVILFGTSYTIKMVKYDEKIDYGKYVSSIIYIPVFSTVLLVIVLKIISLFTVNLADLSIEIWYAIIISSGFSAVSNIVVGKFILEGEYKKYIFYSLIYTTLNIGISLILCYTIFRSRNAYWARIIGTLVANIGSCVFVLFFTKIQIPSIQYIKKGIIMGIPMLIHSIATQLLVQTDKIIIGRLASYSSVGIYTAATNIVVIPMTILNSIENSWSPWFFENLSKVKYKEIRNKNTKILFLFAMGLTLFIMGCPELVKVMTSSNYWEAVFVLIPLTIATFAEIIYMIPLNLELYYKKSDAIWVYTSIAVLVNVVFDIIFIKTIGYKSAAYVTCSARMLLFALHYIRAKHIDKNDILDLKIVIFALLILFIAGIQTKVLVDNWPVRWGCIAVCIIIIARCIFQEYKSKKEGIP